MRRQAFLCLRRGVSKWTSLLTRIAPLFSAYAEVFPSLWLPETGIRSFSLPTQRCFSVSGLKRRKFRTFLCLRRGVSLWDIPDCSIPSLFSAYAEVFLSPELFMPRMSAFLCLRRGVSTHLAVVDELHAFSLPTQRCFIAAALAHFGDLLFSAYAEVFLTRDEADFLIKAFLCLRRGVSPSRPHGCGARRFSLPTQRCFQSKCCRKPPTSLFSAYAEVFLSSTALSPSTGTFLCLRRGVSQAFDQPITPPGFSLPTQRCF